MAYYLLWTPFPKIITTGSLLSSFPALESFSIQDSKKFNSSSEDVNRNTINARIQMLLVEVRGFYLSKLEIRRASGDNDEVFEFDVYFARARDADTRGVLMRGE
jgi:Rieske Fe-S protein